MCSPASAKLEDFENIIKLINNIFRISRGFTPTMQSEFPILLNKKNINNMIVIKENEIPVSVVSYIPWEISIEGISIRSASIGAVCTSEEHRCKKYSSSILDYVEKKMVKEDIDILLVSGTRDLYKRRGLVEVESFYEHIIKPEDVKLDIELYEYKAQYLDNLLNMYNQNATRYFRTRDEFETLLHSATMPWGVFSYRKYVIVKNTEIIGYIILRIINNKNASVVELFGEKDIILNVMKRLAMDLNLEYIKYLVHVNDLKNKLNICGRTANITCNQGTIKIMNFSGLMNKLRPYFSQYIPNKILDKINFIENEKGYYINIQNEKLYIDNVESLTKLIFEGYRKSFDLKGKDNIREFIDKVFPLPFVWTANLNYQ